MERCDLILQRAPAHVDALAGPCARHGLRVDALREGAVLLRAVPVQTATELAAALLAHGAHVLLRPIGGPGEPREAPPGATPGAAPAAGKGLAAGEGSHRPVLAATDFAPDPALVGALPTPVFGQDLLAVEDAGGAEPDAWALDPALLAATDAASIDFDHGADGERLEAKARAERPRVSVPMGPLELEPISGRFAALGRPPGPDPPRPRAPGAGVGLAPHLLRDGPEVLHVVRPPGGGKASRSPGASSPGPVTPAQRGLGFWAVALGAPLIPLSPAAWAWHGRTVALATLGVALWVALHRVIGLTPVHTLVAVSALLLVAAGWIGALARFYGACLAGAADRTGEPGPPPPLFAHFRAEAAFPGLALLGFLTVALGMPAWLAYRGLDTLTADVRTLWPVMVALPVLYLPIGLALNTADGNTRAIWNIPRGVFAALRAPLQVPVAWLLSGAAWWGMGLAVLAVRDVAFPGALAGAPGASTVVLGAVAALGVAWAVGVSGAVFGGIATSRPGIWD